MRTASRRFLVATLIGLLAPTISANVLYIALKPDEFPYLHEHIIFVSAVSCATFLVGNSLLVASIFLAKRHFSILFVLNSSLFLLINGLMDYGYITSGGGHGTPGAGFGWFAFIPLGMITTIGGWFFWGTDARMKTLP